MTIQEFRQIQAEMPDLELIKKAKQEISRLCKTGGHSLKMSVPPLATDTDMIIVEIIRRYEEKLLQK